MENEGKEEEKFDFTRRGEALGYLSLDQARILAMRTDREAPGDYGRRFRNIVMAFEVVQADETEDYYEVTLSFRPQGEFTGVQGQEQFFIEKEGNVAVRQVLSLPRRRGERRSLVIPAAIVLVAVVIAMVFGVILAVGSGNGNETVIGADVLPANLSSTVASSVTPSSAVPTATPFEPVGEVRTDGPTPTSGLITRPAVAVPASTSVAAGGLRRGNTILGSVTDAESGRALANVKVRDDCMEENGPIAETHTGTNGEYTIRRLAPGRYQIRAEPDDQLYIKQFYNDKLNRNTADLLTINGSEPVLGLDFSLRVGATISGTVTDRETGLPIPGIEVHVELVGQGELFETRTDRNGEYVTRGLPNGVIELSMRGPAYIVRRTRVVVGGAADLVSVDLSLGPGATVSGTVTDSETGLPIADIEVRVRRVDGANLPDPDRPQRGILHGRAAQR